MYLWDQIIKPTKIRISLLQSEFIKVDTLPIVERREEPYMMERKIGGGGGKVPRRSPTVALGLGLCAHYSEAGRG